MAISTRDQLINALANNASRLVIDKASIANAVAGAYQSLFRATGIPAQAAIPGTTAALCDNTLLGALGFTQQTLPARSYLGQLDTLSSNNTTTLELRDRLGHMGGLNGTLTTSQTVGLDLLTTGGGISADRRGDANYSDVGWFMEWYTDTGATASNATVNVTYDDASTGNLAVIAVGGTIRASRMIQLLPAVNGRFIRAVNSITLSANTTAAGNFGVTATRLRAMGSLLIANLAAKMKWDDLGLSEIPNGSCLMFDVIPSTTSTGTLRGTGKIIHG